MTGSSRTPKSRIIRGFPIPSQEKRGQCHRDLLLQEWLTARTVRRGAQIQAIELPSIGVQELKQGEIELEVARHPAAPLLEYDGKFRGAGRPPILFPGQEIDGS